MAARRPRWYRKRALATLFLLLVLPWESGSGTGGVSYGRPPPVRARLVRSYGKIPLQFEENRGQIDPQVRFLSRGRGYVLFLTPGGAVLALRRPAAEASSERKTKPKTVTARTESAAVRMRLVGANPNPEMAGRGLLPGKSHYFIGNDPKKWRRNIPHYAKAEYKAVYPGVDLVYYGNQQKLEYDFIVRPGADYRKIRIRFEGAEGLALDGKGDLILSLGGGKIVQKKPHVYQMAGGVKQLIEGRYIRKGKNEVGFEVAAHDRTKPLVIDPVLEYSTYLGGSLGDVGFGVAVDASGNVYVTGSTPRSGFPVTNSLSKNSGIDVFVLKFNHSGTTLLYATVIGGGGIDIGKAIAVDASGNVYVTGLTGTFFGDYPVVNAFQPNFGNPGNGSVNDAFVTKLNPTGSALIFSTFLGGNINDEGNGIALDSSGNVYVTGVTSSTNFPLANPFQAGLGGQTDAFVAKLNAAGSALVYSTYLGGGATDAGNGIAVDGAGNAYVTGVASGSSLSFPFTSGAFQTSVSFQATFVSKLDASGTTLVYSTALGGSLNNTANAITVDGNGNAHVTGWTFGGFPLKNPFQATPPSGGDRHAFVTKFNAAGSDLVFSTYLGGTLEDKGTGIAVDGQGNVYVAGHTRSGDFPTQKPLQAKSGGQDAFVSVLRPDGSSLAYSTFLGGSGEDRANAIAVDAAGNAYVTGRTASTDFPTASFQNANAGGDDAFLTKIADPPALVAPTLISPSGTIADNTPAYQWNAVPGATWYQLWVNDSTKNKKILKWFTAAASGCPLGAGTCSVTPSTALADGDAKWWVKGWNKSQGSGPWSSGMPFSVFTGPLAAPAQTAPAGTIADRTPTYSWKAVSGGTWYKLAVDDSTGRRINKWFRAAEVGCPLGTGSCTVTPAVTLALGNGTWWVRGWNNLRGSGPWSSGLAFQVTDALTPPVPIAPSGTIQTQTPAFSWQAVPNATWYKLAANDSTGRRINKWFRATNLGCGGGSGTCSVTSPVVLAQGNGTWWARGWNNTRGSGPWSSGKTFRIDIPLAPPTQTSPTGTIQTLTPTFTWQPVLTATWYQLAVNDSTGRVITRWFSAINLGCGTGKCSIAPGTVLAQGGGTWWVRGWNSVKGTGPWSAGMIFSVKIPLIPPKPISPSGNITNRTPAFQWGAVPTATWYLLVVDDSTGRRIRKWFRAGDLGCGAGTGNCTAAPGVLLAFGNGSWSVRGWNRFRGSGPSSLVTAFNVVGFSLTVTKAGDGSGTVTSNPAGINCGADCTETYGPGTQVTLTATPDAGVEFTGWSGACTGTGACPLTMDAAKSVTANFRRVFVLTVAKAGDGSGAVTSSPAGISCGNDCQEAYTPGTNVALSANPGANSVFSGWSGACSGIGACQVTMNANRNVTATFTQIFPSTDIQFNVPAQLPAGMVGDQYTFQLCQPPAAVNAVNCGSLTNNNTTNPTGGKPPYTFHLGTGGGFPPFGITLNLNGTLSGTPTIKGQRTFTVCAVDISRSAVCRQTTLDIQDPPQITVRDNGTLADDAFSVAINGTEVCRTTIGAANTCDIGNLSSGNVTLTITAIIAPDNLGTFEITLARGLTFSDGSTVKSGTMALGASVSFTVIVP